MNIYNIAYIPVSKSQAFINLCSSKCKKSAGYYLDETSRPHITICRFMSDPTDLDKTWEKVQMFLDKKKITISFEKVSQISFNNKIYWTSLIPKDSTNLLKAYEVISKIVKSLRNDTYDPHLTLFNSYENSLKKMDDKITELNDQFEIVLGESDEIGQFKKILYSQDSNKIKFSLA